MQPTCSRPAPLPRPLPPPPTLARLAGPGQGLSAEEGRATPLPSILHLHYNRAVCIPTAAEDTVLALVRNAVQARLDRRAQRP